MSELPAPSPERPAAGSAAKPASAGAAPAPAAAAPRGAETAANAAPAGAGQPPGGWAPPQKPGTYGTWIPPQKPGDKGTWIPGQKPAQAAPQPAVQPTAPGVVLPDDAPRPAAGPARMRPRHYGVILSAALMVLLPFVLYAGYLFGVARDQYASTVGFTVRQEEAPSASALAGGLASMLGVSGGGSNTRVLYEYIRSPALVARVQSQLDLRGHYSPGWPLDVVYSIWPDATIEELTRFWLRMVSISFDETSGLMSIEVRAMTPEMATKIAGLVVSESQTMINDLNAAARADAMRYADEDMAEAINRLRSAREAMISFRATTQILDPVADLEGRMGIMNSLQSQLAQAMVDLDLLAETSDSNDPRHRQLERRIEVIAARIEAERQALGGNSVSTLTQNDYPELLARYEGLTVDVHVAEATYRTAQAAHDLAKAKAERQSLYLATYISPTSAEMSEYPRRFLLLAMAAVFLTLLWSISVLIYYSLRDRS